MPDFLDTLAASGSRFLDYGTTAIDAYRRNAPAPVRHMLFEGGIVELAKIFDGLEYPGLPDVDASLGFGPATGAEIRFLCVDELDRTGIGAGPAADFRRNPVNGFFGDPRGIYPLLRASKYPIPDPSAPGALFEAATLAARAGEPAETVSAREFAVPPEYPSLRQKDLLSLVLTGPEPAKGMEILLGSGFVDRHWPELAALVGVDHAKDHHPEGGGWAHTMETFSHRKTPDLVLSLALLLHDTGKPGSVAAEGRRFDRHAEIGARVAEGFLRRLSYAPGIVRDVSFLIESHMMPAALPRLPMSTVGRIVADPRFPLLLELYRCDEFSTFRGPEAYYEACAAYKTYLRNRKNPYRDTEGRKLGSARRSSAEWVAEITHRGGL